jgi:molybdenum cofactor synthesis domain-containing protein
VSALASFGVAQPQVHRRVRVGVLVTGNELLGIDARPTPWQIRDSNGPTLSAMLSACPWLQVRPPIHVMDEPDRQQSALGDLLEGCDAVLLTGGVSMGQYDHVPAVVTLLGGRTVFHKLPIRPGKPMLAAVGPQGQAVLGLPGNPISVMVTARRLGGVVLRHLAGFSNAASPVPVVTLTHSNDRMLPLVWFRPVRLTGPGRAELVASRGSGDMVSAARSDGFVEIPPASRGEGPWPFYRWEL